MGCWSGSSRIGLVRGATPRGASNFSSLETDAGPEFDVSRLCLTIDSNAIVWCSVVPKSAKAGSVVESEVVIGSLIMVQNVGEDALELQVDTLCYLEALLNTEVHIPVRQPTQNSGAAIPVIDPKNWVAPVRGLK